jgi:hypothetical protein
VVVGVVDTPAAEQCDRARARHHRLPKGCQSSVRRCFRECGRCFIPNSPRWRLFPWAARAGEREDLPQSIQRLLGPEVAAIRTAPLGSGSMLVIVDRGNFFTGLPMKKGRLRHDDPRLQREAKAKGRIPPRCRRPKASAPRLAPKVPEACPASTGPNRPWTEASSATFREAEAKVRVAQATSQSSPRTKQTAAFSKALQQALVGRRSNSRGHRTSADRGK